MPQARWRLFGSVKPVLLAGLLSLSAATTTQVERPPTREERRLTTVDERQYGVAPSRLVARLPLELHTAARMPIAKSLALQAAVLFSAAFSVSVSDIGLPPGGILAAVRRTVLAWCPEEYRLVASWLLSLISLGFYAHHCATCYPAQLIRRRIDSMEPVERMGSANPSIRWRARAYHWERRWRRVTTRTKNGGTSTRWESYQVQVTTHVAEAILPALRWSYEERRAGSLLPGQQPCVTPWTSVRADFRVCPLRPQDYELVRSEFQFVHSRDHYLDFTETVSLGGHVLRPMRKSPEERATWATSRFYLLVSQVTRLGVPNVVTWALVCILMVSAPYQAWLAARMKTIGAAGAVEYTRAFERDVQAARAQLQFDQRAVVDRERALEARRRWRGMRFLTDVAAGTLSLP